MEGVIMKDTTCGHCSIMAHTMRPRPEDWIRNVDPNCPIHGLLASAEYQDDLLRLFNRKKKGWDNV